MHGSPAHMRILGVPNHRSNLISICLPKFDLGGPTLKSFHHLYSIAI